mgnify:CR=1 FL=1
MAKFIVLNAVYDLCVLLCRSRKRSRAERRSACLFAPTALGIGANEQAVRKVSDERITLMSVRLNARSG